ncbi:MAG: hypothetical protein AAF829_06720 [Pseudomonadota bacterium]
MNRRGFIAGALAAPAVVVTPGLLMPVRPFTPTARPFGEGLRLVWPYLTNPDQAAGQALYSLQLSMEREAAIALGVPYHKLWTG